MSERIFIAKPDRKGSGISIGFPNKLDLDEFALKHPGAH